MSFSDNIWWTRKAKIQAEKRLLKSAFHAQVILLWYSFFSVVIAIYHLEFSSSESDVSGIAWVSYSVLVLVISGFINGLSFKERASLIKECYEALNQIYHKAKKDEDSEDIKKEYDQIIGVCENHTDRDFYHALVETYFVENNREKLSKTPTKYIFFMSAWYRIIRFFLLSFMYVLPVLLFIYLEIVSC